MSIELFEEISLILGIGGLVLYMVFVMAKLAKESIAGPFGSTMIFLTLGLGIVGFAAKSVIQFVIEVWMVAVRRSRLLLQLTAR